MFKSLLQLLNKGGELRSASLDPPYPLLLRELRIQRSEASLTPYDPSFFLPKYYGSFFIIIF